MPSIASLLDRVSPAVVNISVELKVQTAAQDESDTRQEGALPFGPGSTPFDQFLHRLLEPNREASSEHAREQTATALDLLQIDTYGTGIAAVLSDNR